MTQKETNLRSILFLIIGILLLLSLVICIYIVSRERDLVETKAKVTDVSKSTSSTGSTEITVEYDIDGQLYKYKYDYKGKIKTGDEVTIYFHKNNPTVVQRFKTNKLVYIWPLIFVWPIIGLVLCVFGIIELLRKNDDGEKDYESSIIAEIGNTQQMKIVTDNIEVEMYEPTPEEMAETPVKSVVKENPEDIEQLDEEFENLTDDSVEDLEESITKKVKEDVKNLTLSDGELKQIIKDIIKKVQK